ncbi:hypothetical protein BDZ94DRAFT_1047007 [Collybia nuda]|uniref:Uncharacterized protein n=1 Tax=Collybia nuda TaxID=64659 RepID=A0A9P5XZ72_9AGAR|nr:hypothetical protein BDZ94DRAFT_1047007 [Collybia nuda]
MSSQQPPIPTQLVVPIIEAYASGIQPAFPFILISAVFSAMLIPLFLMLLVLSTSSSRRQPIFILNVLTISLGVIVAVLSNHLTISSILSPFRGVNPTEDLVYNILYIWLPWITEAILVLRVIVVYGLNITGPHLKPLLMILTFPIVIKTLRAALNIAFLVRWTRDTFSGESLNQFKTTQDLRIWMVPASWILELVDNLYISALFLLRLVTAGHIFNARSVGRESANSRNSISSRMRALFWIATTNLVFPVTFNLTAVIVFFATDNILLAASIEMCNMYVAIICTAFSTIWAGTASFKDAHRSTNLTSTSGRYTKTLPPQMIFKKSDPYQMKTMTSLGTSDVEYNLGSSDNRGEMGKMDEHICPT